jgi:hypothetical protein
MNIGGLVVGEDLMTAVSGSFNLAYFAEHAWNGSLGRDRRIAAVTLALVGGAAVIEAAFSQALFWFQPQLISFGELSVGVWALVRLPLLVATLLVSILVLRRLRS